MFTIISFYEKLIKGDWNKGGLENFSKINMGGAIIRYSRVLNSFHLACRANFGQAGLFNDDFGMVRYSI